MCILPDRATEFPSHQFHSSTGTPSCMRMLVKTVLSACTGLNSLGPQMVPRKSQELQFPSHSTTEGPTSSDIARDPQGSLCHPVLLAASPGFLPLCCSALYPPTACCPSSQPPPSSQLSSCLALAGQLPLGAQLGPLVPLQLIPLLCSSTCSPLSPSFCSRNIAGSLLLQDFCSSWDRSFQDLCWLAGVFSSSDPGVAARRGLLWSRPSTRGPSPCPGAPVPLKPQPLLWPSPYVSLSD